MAPAISPGSAATALSILILAASNIGMWLRIADVAAAPRDQLSEPEFELTLGRLENKLGQLEGAMATLQASIAGLDVRTARCEALLEPLEEHKPDQSTPGATNLTNRSIGTNTINTTAGGLARPKLGRGTVQNPLSGDGHAQVQERRRAQANGGGTGADDAGSAAVAVKQFKIDVQPVQVVIDGNNGRMVGWWRGRGAAGGGGAGGACAKGAASQCRPPTTGCRPEAPLVAGPGSRQPPSGRAYGP
eukprot:COSAG04_NODE_5159_length_1717_cov_4.026576_1_plen_246_part_00